MYNKSFSEDLTTNLPPNEQLADYNPIVGYISPETIICRDGMLLQTIEIDSIEGLHLDNYEDIAGLRREIRSSILDIFNDPKICIYIQTIRRRRNIMAKGVIPFGFPDELNREWVKKNNWDKQLCNTIYITIAIQSSSYSLFNPANFIDSLFYPLLKKRFNAETNSLEKELTSKADELIKRLNRFGARRIGLKKVADGYISEHLNLFYQLTHLRAKNCYLPIRDFSKFLAHASIVNHFNHIEIGQSNEDKSYCAIFTVKQNIDLDIKVIDPLMHMGSEFVITQVIIFTPAADAKKAFDRLHRLLSFDKEGDLLTESGIKEYYAVDEGYGNDYAKTFTFINIYSDNEKFFHNKVKSLIDVANKMGLVLVREDFNMPKSFWSQIPGNFRSIPKDRLLYNSTSRIGQFLSLINENSGSFLGAKWGNPITLIRAVKGTPYYFNFHNKSGNGNTLLLGPLGAGKRVLMRFLITQSLKLSPRIINIDFLGASSQFYKVLGGKNLKISHKQPSCFKINPFNLKNFEGEKDEFRVWLHRAVYPTTESLPQFVEFFNIITSHIFSAEASISKLEIIRAAIAKSPDEILKANFENHLGSQAFDNLFTEDGEAETLKLLLSNDIINIDIADIVDNQLLLEAYLGLLLRVIGRSLDRSPTIIVIEDTAKLMEVKHFANYFEKWLAELTIHNSMAFCCTTRGEKIDNNQNFKKPLGQFGTKLFTSDKYADKYFRLTYGLEENELNNLKSYEKNRRIFLLKQDKLSVFLQLNLDGLDDELNILSLNDGDSR